MTPGKDDNEVWHNSCRNRLKVSMGVQYQMGRKYKNRMVTTEARAKPWRVVTRV